MMVSNCQLGFSGTALRGERIFRLNRQALRSLLCLSGRLRHLVLSFASKLRFEINHLSAKALDLKFGGPKLLISRPELLSARLYLGGQPLTARLPPKGGFLAKDEVQRGTVQAEV